MPWFCFRIGPCQWRVEILPAMTELKETDEATDSELVNQLFKQQIKQHPEQYLWVHRRFKNQPKGIDNPYQ